MNDPPLASLPHSLKHPNAVLEGGQPFPLTVRSSSGWRVPGGAYRFDGDYLREIEPAGTQYLFSWTFAPDANGQTVWNGSIGWAGGHLWHVAISNVTVVPVPWLDISRPGVGSIEVSWSTNFAWYLLEETTGTREADWRVVTNAVGYANDRLLVALDTSGSARFFRLRKP